MKEKHHLQVGDTVLWRGPLGEPAIQSARVSGIEKDADAFTHNGQEVDVLPWKQVKRATVVFDNGYWDYGSHIRRLKQPKAWRSAGYSRPTPETPPATTPQPVEQAAKASVPDDRRHIDFLQGILQYEWETTPDDTEDRKELLQGIEQAQAWLHGLESAHGREPAGAAEELPSHCPA